TFIVLEKTQDHISSHSLTNLPFGLSETFILRGTAASLLLT
ncbi:hypothetical protein MAE30S32_14970, partial [Microcystis aeruginosa 11-30S32]